MTSRRAAAVTLALFTVLSGIDVTPARAAGWSLPPAQDCSDDTPAMAVQRADRIMARHLAFTTHPDFVLPADPTWREQPFKGDPNWLFNYHSLRWVLPLLQAGRETGRAAYTARAAFLLKDWLASDPRSSRAPYMAWNDMTAGWRASVLACAVGDLGRPAWLIAGLKGHGTALADPKFYAGEGNHALNQVIGFVDVACVLPSPRWRSLATTRMASLVTDSIDSQGVTNEQAIGYQVYNYTQYERARRHLTTCGIALPSAFSRVALMSEFLAHATAPDGRYAQLGDTDLQRARTIRGTVADYAASAGASGPKPGAVIQRYAAGYLFARSGWGETRPFDAETFITLRFGPGLKLHGHLDGQSLTLAAKGRGLLVDPGKFTYTAGAFKDWFESRAAHNVVLVDGSTYARTTPTTMSTSGRPDTYYAAMSNGGYPGVINTRRVVWSRQTDYLIVDDVLASSTVRTYRQTWHLARGAAPTISGDRLDTDFAGGNLAIVQLVGHPQLTVVGGKTKPIQGWVSEQYNVKYSAPVLQATVRATQARYLTLLVPYSGVRPVIRGRVISLTTTGYVVEVTIGARTERMTVTSKGAIRSDPGSSGPRDATGATR